MLASGQPLKWFQYAIGVFHLFLIIKALSSDAYNEGLHDEHDNPAQNTQLFHGRLTAIYLEHFWVYFD